MLKLVSKDNFLVKPDFFQYLHNEILKNVEVTAFVQAA